MGFPTDPNDGDEYTNALGTKYKYLTADDKWYIMSITAGDLLHNELDGLNADETYEHITQTQKNALHSILTNLTQLGTREHIALQNKNAEENVKHLTDAEVSALHAVLTNLNQLGTRLHSDLQDKNTETDIKHITDGQLSALHTIYSLEVHNNDKHNPDYEVANANIQSHVASPPTSAHHVKTVSGDITLNGLSEKNHVSLANKNAETDIKHLTDDQLAALHAKQHAMDDVAEHTSSDIAILNSSISKHGFLKKLDNNANNFMNGEGNWAAPAGGPEGFAPPIGFITMFSGTWEDNVTIPGWYKCDGNNGTVNLVDKFVRGGTTSGASGGSDDAVVVQHNHGIVDNGHVHNVKAVTMYTGLESTYHRGLTSSGTSRSGLIYNATTGITINNEGVSGVGTNKPVYYTLIFIQRIS